MKENLLQYYTNLLSEDGVPEFLTKYLNVPSLVRLKNVGYFCGMDYASKNIYDFGEYISRYDHSVTVALMTYKLTKDKKATLAGLFHDISTPCFSHVIDYMNKDYEIQESTEAHTERILKNDNYLLNQLAQDNVDIEEITNFKKYTIVDNDRPKACTDRIDGIVLNGIGWAKNISKLDIKNIVNSMEVVINEFNEPEISFNNEHIAKKIIEINRSIDKLCHSKEDSYMMELLADITKTSIEKSYIKHADLYTLNEKEILTKLANYKDSKLNDLLYTFKTIKLNDIPSLEMPKIKVRKLTPLVRGKRVKTI